MKQANHYTVAAKYGSNSIVPTRECTLACTCPSACDADSDIIPQPVNTFFCTDGDKSDQVFTPSLPTSRLAYLCRSLDKISGKI